MPDVLQKIDQRHTDLLLQPEFFVGDLDADDGHVEPGHPARVRLQRRAPPPEHRDARASADGRAACSASTPTSPSHIAIEPRTGREGRGFILGQPEHPGLVQTLPWVVPDPLGPASRWRSAASGSARRASSSRPGSGVACPDPATPGPCEDGHTEGVAVARHRREPHAAVRAATTAGSRRTPFSASRPLARSTERAAQRRASRSAAGASWSPRTRSGAAGTTRSSSCGRTNGGQDVVGAGAAPRRADADEWWPAVAVGANGRVTVAWVDAERARACVLRTIDEPRPQLRLAARARLLGRRRAVEARARAGARRRGARRLHRRARARPGPPAAGARLLRPDRAAASPRRPGGSTPGEPVPLATKFDNSWAPSVAAAASACWSPGSTS